MTNKEFITEMAKRTDMSPKEVSAAIHEFASALADSLSESDTLSVYGFGTFEMVTKKERIVVNPGTGKRMLIPPKRVILFKAGVSLRDKVKSLRIQ